MCFDSLYHDSIDYFILENKSKYSDKIENYFKDKRLLGYLQSEKNITHGTVDYFIKNYRDMVKQYDYFTLTDGDVLVDNVDNLYEEIFSILDKPKVKVCCAMLDNCNLPNHPEAPKWLQRGEIIDGQYMKSISGTFVMTFKRENFDFILDLGHVMDVAVHENIRKHGNGVSAVTIKNKVKHLTWDYYYDGNEYYEWKKNNQWTLKYCKETSNMKRIV
jgi:hypothetical protein